MKLNSMLRRSILASVALVVAVALGVSIAIGGTSSVQPAGRAPDSTTVERLTRGQFNAVQPPLAPSITVTETAAILAAELLLGGYDFTLAMPLISR